MDLKKKLVINIKDKSLSDIYEYESVKNKITKQRNIDDTHLEKTFKKLIQSLKNGKDSELW